MPDNKVESQGQADHHQPLQYFPPCRYFDFESSKIAGIEGENLLDAVDVHESDQPRVMHFRAADAMSGNKALPFFRKWPENPAVE